MIQLACLLVRMSSPQCQRGCYQEDGCEPKGSTVCEHALRLGHNFTFGQWRRVKQLPLRNRRSCCLNCGNTPNIECSLHLLRSIFAKNHDVTMQEVGSEEHRYGNSGLEDQAARATVALKVPSTPGGTLTGLDLIKCIPAPFS